MTQEELLIQVGVLHKHLFRTFTRETKDALLEKFHIDKRDGPILFKKVYGVSIQRYQHDQRLLRAQAILQNGGVRISEVATMVGYKNIYTFSEAYKIKFGYSPSKDLGKKAIL